MSMFKRLNSIDKKLVLTLIGVFLTLAFGTVAIYTAFYESKPGISVVSVNETNVLDVHKPLEELTISFQGEDIQEENLNLRILTIRVENSGQVDILQNYYDRDDIWGIQVQNGEIIEARLVESNSDYIKSNLNPQVVGQQNIIRFTKVIFERRKFFTLEILVLHEKDQLPQIIPLGKIAGIDKVAVVKPQVGEDEQSFLAQVFHGNAWVHIVRLTTYLVGFIVAIVVAVFFAVGISGLRKNRSKASRTKEVKALWGPVATEKGSKKRVVSDIYLNQGLKGLKRTKVLLEDQDKLRRQVRRHEVLKELTVGRGIKELPPELDVFEDVEVVRLSHMGMVNLWPVDYLTENSVLTFSKPDQVLVDTEFKESLDELLDYLETKRI